MLMVTDLLTDLAWSRNMVWVVITTVVIVGAWAAINFIPQVREKLRGWTTVIEYVGLTALTWLGPLTSIVGFFFGALQDAQALAPGQELLVQATLTAGFTWGLLKRIQTSTSVGKS